jgi:DNA-binding NarL/FixJ family response regulator
MTGNGSARASGNQPSGSQASDRGSARASGNQPSGSQASDRGSAWSATVTRASGSQASGSRLSGGQAGAAQERISVFLLDDHEIVRRGLRDLLSAEPDIDVIGEAGTAESALARMPALCPDVAVLDVRLPDGDGVSVCREIRSTLPGTACLMLTSYGDDRALLGAIIAGAAGYVLKQACGSDLVSAVRAVAAGQSTLDADAAQRVMARLRERMSSVDPLSALTDQEKKVLDLVGEGLTNRQIAERMFLAEKTAKNYVSSLLTKLGMQRRSQAAAFVARLAGDTGD